MILTALVLLTGCNAEPDKTVETSEAAVTIKAVESGKCVVVPPTEPVACTMQYDPVCGCDNITYGNACMARGAGVPSSTPGACEEDPNL